MIRVGTGFDAHRLVDGRPLILGGVKIEHEKGLEGHSDADVLCHAVVDAVLGAAALGDIGQMFPDSDPAWKDADSIEMLKQAVGKVHHVGSKINNVDATIVAEQPKLAEHIEQMRTNMAEALEIDVSRVSVKATTVEGMGALGRSEGIAAMAVAAIDDA